MAQLTGSAVCLRISENPISYGLRVRERARVDGRAVIIRVVLLLCSGFAQRSGGRSALDEIEDQQGNGDGGGGHAQLVGGIEEHDGANADGIPLHLGQALSKMAHHGDIQT